MQLVRREGENQGVIRVSIVVHDCQTKDSRLRATHERKVRSNEAVLRVLSLICLQLAGARGREVSGTGGGEANEEDKGATRDREVGGRGGGTVGRGLRGGRATKRERDRGVEGVDVAGRGGLEDAVQASGGILDETGRVGEDKSVQRTSCNQ